MKTLPHTGRAATAAALIALAVAPSAAPGQGNKPPKPPNNTPSLTLDARPETVVFGGDVALSGRLSGTSTDRDVLVRLEGDDTAPYGDAFRATGATTRTSPSGDYEFTIKPARNAQYRVVAESQPPVTSPAKAVFVSPRVGFSVGDPTPRRGQRVRFSGTVAPAHDGRRVQIQRRTSTGSFVTVARATLRDAGTQRSRYSRRIRLRRDGVYRVRIAPHGDHAEGISRERTVDVGG